MGDAAASAGPVGRNAQAGTDWKLNAELLTYSRSKGLFAGIDLTGDEVSQNTEDTTTFYNGNNTCYQEILKGAVACTPKAKPFVRTVAKYFHCDPGITSHRDEVLPKGPHRSGPFLSAGDARFRGIR